MTLCLSGGESCSIPSIAPACCGSGDALKGNVKSQLGTGRVAQEFRHSAGHRKTIGGQNLELNMSKYLKEELINSKKKSKLLNDFFT